MLFCEFDSIVGYRTTEKVASFPGFTRALVKPGNEATEKEG